MDTFETILVVIIIIILVIIIISLIVGSVSYSQYKKCSKNVAALLNVQVPAAQCFLTTINQNNISQQTYDNICQLAKAANKKENIRNDLAQLLLEMELQDYFIIIDAMDACGINKTGLPRKERIMNMS